MSEEVLLFVSVESADPIAVEDAKPLLACRGCLAASRPLRPLERALAALYGELVGTSVRQADILPKFVCSYCNALLVKFKAFRDKCRANQATFLTLHSAGIPITVDLLESGVTGVPYPQLLKTAVQLIILDGNVDGKHNLHNKPGDIRVPIEREQLGHLGNPRLWTNGNECAPTANTGSVEGNDVGLSTGNAEDMNVEDDVDNDCRYSDDSNEDSDVPDCLAGFNSDMYRKDTKKPFKDNVNTDYKKTTKKETKVKSTRQNISANTLLEDDGDMGLLTEATNIVCVDTESDNSDENCLSGTTSKLSRDRIKKVTSVTSKKTSPKSSFNLKKIYKLIKNLKAKKLREKEASKVNKCVSEPAIENHNLLSEKADDLKVLILSTKEQITSKEKNTSDSLVHHDAEELPTVASDVVSLHSDSNNIDDNCLDESSSKLLKDRKNAVNKVVPKKSSGPHSVIEKTTKIKESSTESGFNLNGMMEWIENIKAKKMREKEASVKSGSLPTTEKQILKKKSLKREMWCKNRRLKTEKKLNVVCVALSKEEQIQQVLVRKESENYKRSPYKCDTCYHGYTSPVTYRNHMAKHDPSRGSFVCDICQIRFPIKRNLRGHLAAFHEFNYICNQCGETSKHRNAALHHHNWHKGIKFECKICGKAFEKSTSMFGHMHLSHGGTHPCVICGLKCIGPKGLQYHMKRSHREAIGAVCGNCEVQFHSVGALQRHLTAGDHSHRPCAVCGDSFPNDELLQEHREENHNEIFKCDLCGKSFDSLKMLKSHTHYKYIRKLRPTAAPGLFICEFCGSSKSSQQTLKVHLRTHTGDKPFECHHCGKCFVSKYILKTHIITKHMPPRRRGPPPASSQPTPCRFCDKIFASKQNQLRHENQVHHKIRPFTCDTCGSTHRDKAAMQMHIKTRHLGMPWPKRDRRQRRTRHNQ